MRVGAIVEEKLNGRISRILGHTSSGIGHTILYLTEDGEGLWRFVTCTEFRTIKHPEGVK